MKKQVFVLLLLFCLEDHPAKTQDLRTARLHHLLEHLHQNKLFNGALVAGQNGKIIFSKGYGFAQFADSIPFTPNTPGDCGSIAKTVTATLLWQLHFDGKIDVNQPVHFYLPSFPYKTLLVRDLIFHATGGLPYYPYFFSKIADTTVLTTGLMLGLLEQHRPKPKYSSNQNFYYDDRGFDIAAYLIEQSTGVCYEDHLQKNIFAPLHMRASFVRPARTSQFMPRRTYGYSWRNDTLELNDIDDREGFYGGSNIWFSATDLYKWGTLFYSPSLLSKTVINKAKEPVYINGKRSYITAGGWYNGKTNDAYYYWGSLAGYYSFVYFDASKKFTVAFVSNTNTPQWARPLISSAVANIMTGYTIEPVMEPIRATFDTCKPVQITGTYNITKADTIVITHRENTFYLHPGNGMEYFMAPVTLNEFYVPGVDVWLSFDQMVLSRFHTIIWSSTTRRAKGIRIL